MIDRLEALSRIEQAARLMPATRLALSDVRGHVAAEDISAGVTQPPASMSAMDGYAVRFEDLAKAPEGLELIGEAAAGSPFKGKIEPGQAVRVFTGSVIPDGANHVIIQEDTDRSGQKIRITEPQDQPRNIRLAGIDFRQGQLLISKGRLLDGPALGIAAAANCPEVSVYRKPKVVLIANGDELKLPGNALDLGEIICSTPFALIPLIRLWGGEPVFSGITPDDPDVISKCIADHEDADVMIPLGGASVGDYDYMKSVFSDKGFESVFSKVAIKPGKPTWFGNLNMTHVLGLPGNPASAIVCAHLFLAPLLAFMQGTKIGARETTARLMTDVPANGARETFLRATSHTDQNGQIRATPADNQDSSLMSPFLSANLLIQRAPNSAALKAGDPVPCLFLHQ